MQLKALASRNQYTSLEIDGLDDSANESLLSKVVLSNPGLERLTLTNVGLTTELGTAISACSRLERLRLSTDEFDGRFLEPERLAKLRYLNISSMSQPRFLGRLDRLNGLNELTASFDTLDPKDCAKLASLTSLERLTIQSGLCDLSTAVAVGNNGNLERFVCREHCLFDDAAIRELTKNDGLIELNIGGFLTENAVAKLSVLPALESLVVRSDLIDGKGGKRLQERFRQLDDFDVMPLHASFGSIAKGSDGFARLVPDGGRLALDNLEGSSIADLFGKHRGHLKEGKITLVEFWGTWCGPCLAYENEIRRLHHKYEGLQVVGVHSEKGHEHAEDYLKSNPKPWENIIDESGEIARSFGVMRYPSIFLFDETGVLRVAQPHRLVLEDAISKLLVEQQ
ncbi:MAG TPA: hypothetical protein DDW52_04540 [Planctomycetaceae bacterium]|nr:hypothetical protein [Planctomycetaceae bacterium]